MQLPRFAEAVGAGMAAVALGVAAYAAVAQDKAEALGAIIAIVAAANGYFLRARVKNPKE